MNMTIETPEEKPYPFGIKFEVYPSLITSLQQVYDIVQPRGGKIRKWNTRMHISTEVSQILLADFGNSIPWEVMFSLDEVHPAHEGKVMLHVGSFSPVLSDQVNYGPTDWETVMNTEMKDIPCPIKRVQDFFAEHPGYTFTDSYTPADEPQLRYFLEKVFGTGYEPFLKDMENYDGIFSGIRNERGELISMVNALRDEYDEVIHYELDHAASKVRGSGATVAIIGLIAQLINKTRRAVITAECKIDEINPAYVYARKAGLTIPPVPARSTMIRSEIPVYSRENPLQVIRKQVTVGKENKYYDLLLMLLKYKEIENYYSQESVEQILSFYS